MTATPPSPGRRFAALLALALVCVGTPGCAPVTPRDGIFTVRETTPAFLRAVEARDPVMGTDGRGTVALAWASGDSLAADLWLSISRDSGTTFTPPARVNEASARVVTSASSSPAVAVGAGGALAVAWSEWRDDGSGAIDLRVRGSADFGRTLGPIATLNDDASGPPAGLRWRQLRDWPLTHRPNAAHGAAALAFTGDGSLLAAWLDDRRAVPPDTTRIATLWHALSSDGGQSWTANAALSDSASPRCAPTLAVAADGAVALAYRDASNGGNSVRLVIGRDARGFDLDTLIARAVSRAPLGTAERIALAWEPSAGGVAAWSTGAAPSGVSLARWRRGGGVAGPQRPVAEDLFAAGNPHMTLLTDALVIGVEAPDTANAARHTLAVRVLDHAGNWSPWTILGAHASSGGLVAPGQQRALACWIEHEPGHTRLRIASLTRRSGGGA